MTTSDPTAETPASPPVVSKTCKMILCVLPDDGCHAKLLKSIKEDGRTARATCQSCLGIDTLADASVRPGTLPDAYLARIVRIVVEADHADDLFEFVCEQADVGRPGGGVILQAPLIAATHYELPEGVPDE